MKKLSIPEHISLDKEYMPGMGARELRQFLIAALPGLVVMIVVWMVAGEPGIQLMSMLLGVGYIAMCYAFFVKIEGGQSMYTFLARILRFYREQRSYYFKVEQEAIRYAADHSQP